MPNRLAGERSPYLLQHAHNPVDWYPWGAEAFDRARDLDRPIFLSVGYAACHWCHVMERESFENPRIAEILNQSFVSIKVDREERPDVDQIYMQAVMAMRGQGGWPLSAFLTPQQEIFFGGTYWPPSNRHGMPGFDSILLRIAEAYRERRAEIAQQAATLTEFLAAGSFPAQDDSSPLDRAGLVRIARELERHADWQHGGFGSAPKFPHTMELEFLLRVAQDPDASQVATPLRSEPIVRLSLDKMSAGGIYDHLGGGFARYSVDEMWLVPHFEKMLYDNGLLARIYLEAYRAWGEARDAEVARESLHYLLRDLGDSSGGFHSSEDADSEGDEGKFYVWSAAEIQRVLGADGPLFCEVYGVTAGGNFEGHNILHRTRPDEDWAVRLRVPRPELSARLAACRRRLFEVRGQRTRPAKDDKVLTSWNGLAIESLAVAAVVLPDDDEARSTFLSAAQRAAGFFLRAMRTPDGGLYHAYRHGQPYQLGFVDDYANLINALLSLYAADWDLQWLQGACQLTSVLLAEFSDPDRGGFYFCGRRHEPLIARSKEYQDNSIPSGNSAAATALARLGNLIQSSEWIAAAEATLRSALPLIHRAPAAAAQMLIAAEMLTRPQHVVVIATNPADEPAVRKLVRAIQRRWHPEWQFVLIPSGTEIPAELREPLQDKTSRDGLSALYHCRGFACDAPVIGRAAIESFLGTYPQTPSPVSADKQGAGADKS